MKWIHDHSLSVVVVTIWAVLVMISAVLFDGTWVEWFAERSGGHSDDAFGAILIIIGTKFLLERGRNPSEESK